MEDSAARRGRWCDDAEGNVATLEAARVGMADLWGCEGWRGARCAARGTGERQRNGGCKKLHEGNEGLGRRGIEIKNLGEGNPKSNLKPAQPEGKRELMGHLMGLVHEIFKWALEIKNNHTYK
ncbi:hypothetical protein SAY87_030634 [Trapa incisa]|uniref:Uncharacterized protein n=1 Tax=Trapa incisa TaxID=236973 RepID=A0AAN7QJX0_9MYRT|nr:hypothetical protein SAY87_030634 [Trapa incisa]